MGLLEKIWKKDISAKREFEVLAEWHAKKE